MYTLFSPQDSLYPMYLTFSSLVKGLKQLHCDKSPSLECCWNESLNLEMSSLILKSMVTFKQNVKVSLGFVSHSSSFLRQSQKPLTRAMLTSGIALKKVIPVAIWSLQLCDPAPLIGLFFLSGGCTRSLQFFLYLVP